MLVAHSAYLTRHWQRCPASLRAPSSGSVSSSFVDLGFARQPLKQMTQIVQLITSIDYKKATPVWLPAPFYLPLSKASLSLFNTSADVGPCFLYIANNPFKDCSFGRELVIGEAVLVTLPAMLVFFFGK